MKKIDISLRLKIFSWFWYKDKPVNYNPKILSIFSFFSFTYTREYRKIISRKALKKYKCRFGCKPSFLKLL